MLVGLVLGVLFVTPIVLTYLFVIRWVDRFEPAPWWLIVAAFVWGAIFATLGSGIGASIAQAVVSPFVEPAAADVLGATVFAPIFEETFKGLGVVLIALVSARGTRKLEGPLDGAICGAAVGLGFGLTEDTLSVAYQYATSGLQGFVVFLFLRTVFLGLSHCTFTACTGLGVGIAAEAASGRVKLGAPFVGFGCALAMHAMHNALPTLFGSGGIVVMTLVSWGIDILFFVVLALLVVRDFATGRRMSKTRRGSAP